MLPSKHSFAQLLIEQEHRINLYAGTQTTLASIRNKFNRTRASHQSLRRNAVRRLIRRCVVCLKIRPVIHQPLMGDLPKIPVEPFINAGVDYCGPFLIGESFRRKAPIRKVYVAVFICMSTKAVAMEIVSSFLHKCVKKVR
ncbi:hypothetical protein QE152_g40449 [Popillia japonica]|uniref:Uncharacterized protein n=1 Tax=Popillia japonica TaxID=7064 RepID=A0AAW1HQ84_POPJA